MDPAQESSDPAATIVAGRGSGRPSLAPLRHQSTWIILAAFFCINLGVQFISPLLPAMRSNLHLSPVEIGWIVGGYSLPALLVTLPLGILADVWGSRRVLAGCLGVFGLAGLGALSADGFPHLLAWRVVQGLAVAPIASITIAMLADTLPRAEQAMAQSYRSVVGSASEFVQPVLAGFLLAMAGSWRPAFLLFVLPLGVAVWAFFGLTDSAPRRVARASGGYSSDALTALRDPAILGVGFAGFARWFLKYGFFSYVPLYLASHVHAGPAEIGYVIGIPGLVAALVASQAGRLGLERRGRLALILALVVFGACIPAITLYPSVGWAALVTAVQGLSDGVIGPLLNSFISFLPAASVRVTVVSVSGLVRNLGKSIAPAAVGALVLRAGYPLAFGAVGLLSMTAPVYLLPLLWSSSHSSTTLRAGSGASQK